MLRGENINLHEISTNQHVILGNGIFSHGVYLRKVSSSNVVHTEHHATHGDLQLRLGEQPTRLGVKWQALLQHSHHVNSKDIQGRCAGSILD